MVLTKFNPSQLQTKEPDSCRLSFPAYNIPNFIRNLLNLKGAESVSGNPAKQNEIPDLACN
jgi:hypothetical protein